MNNTTTTTPNRQASDPTVFMDIRDIGANPHLNGGEKTALIICRLNGIKTHFKSLDTLAKAFGVGPRQARRTMAALQLMKLVSFHYRYDEGNLRVYKILHLENLNTLTSLTCSSARVRGKAMFDLSELIDMPEGLSTFRGSVHYNSVRRIQDALEGGFSYDPGIALQGNGVTLEGVNLTPGATFTPEGSHAIALQGNDHCPTGQRPLPYRATTIALQGNDHCPSGPVNDSGIDSGIVSLNVPLNGSAIQSSPSGEDTAQPAVVRHSTTTAASFPATELARIKVKQPESAQVSQDSFGSDTVLSQPPGLRSDKVFPAADEPSATNRIERALELLTRGYQHE